VLEGAPAREGAEIADEAGKVIGVVTSGGFAPSLFGGPIAIGFVPPAFAVVGTKLKVIVRGKAQAAEVVATPFVAHRYVRKGSDQGAQTCASPKITNGSSSRATSPPSASPPMPPSSWATWCSSRFRKSGKTVKAGDGLAVVESVKAASDVYAPVSGEVVEGNAELATRPRRSTPCRKAGGWFAKIKVSTPPRSTP
jgi:biotin carboxyl carrier protein